MPHRHRRLAFLILTVALTVAVAAPAEELVLQPGAAAGKDTYVSIDSPTTAYGGQSYLYFGGIPQNGELRLYIEFDLSILEPGSTVDTAQLELYMASQNGEMTFNYSVMQITAAWNEATLTWNTQPAFDPVAVTAFSGETWQAAYLNWHTIGGLETLVQTWVDHPEQNFGLLIKPTSTYYGYPLIWSSDYSTAGLRPRLVINGALVDTAPASWDEVKALFR